MGRPRHSTRCVEDEGCPCRSPGTRWRVGEAAPRQLARPVSKLTVDIVFIRKSFFVMLSSQIHWNQFLLSTLFIEIEKEIRRIDVLNDFSQIERKN